MPTGAAVAKKKQPGVRRLRRNSTVTYNSRLYIYISDDEKSAIQRAADAQGVSMSAYIAASAVSKAKKELGE